MAQTIPGTPAVKYGLKNDDIITAVDDTPIHDADSFVLSVGKLPVEAVAHLSVIRDGRPRSVEVKLTKYAVRGKKIVTVPDPLWRGMRVEYPSAMMNAEVRATGPSPFAGEGVIVAEVAENSPALKAGLQPGMVVTHVGRTAINMPKEFRAAVENISGPVVLAHRRRQKESHPHRGTGDVKLLQIQNSLRAGFWFLICCSIGLPRLNDITIFFPSGDHEDPTFRIDGSCPASFCGGFSP